MSEATKQLRTVLRSKITRAYKAATAGCLHESATIAWCVQSSNNLIAYDEEIQDAEPDIDYYARLRFVKTYIQEEERLLQEAAKQEELARVETEQKAQLDNEEREHRRTLREAEIAALTNRLSSTSIPSTSFSTVSQGRIAKEARPEPFDGRPSSYQSFEESFVCAYENNDAYADYDKFTIFKNLVGVHGKHLVATLKPTRDGLQQAKERMKKTFNPAALVRKDVLGLFEDLPTIKDSRQTGAMRSLLFTLERGVQALKDCSTHVNTINISYLPLITKRLPRELMHRYYDKYNAVDMDVDIFIEFLRTTISREEWTNEMQDVPLEETKPKQRAKVNTLIASPRTTSPSHGQPSSRHTHSAFQSRGSPRTQCVFCNGPHVRFYCDRLSASERRTIARQKHLCFVCLNTGHTTHECTSSYRCTSCGERHSHVICTNPTQSRSPSRQQQQQSRRTNLPSFNRSQSESALNDSPASNATVNSVPVIRSGQTPPSTPTTDASTSPATSTVSAISTLTQSHGSSNFESYLMTAIVNIKSVPVRVFLDFGATRSLISQQLVKRLNLPVVAQQHLDIGGWDGFHGASSQQVIKASLSSLNGLATLDTELSVTDKLHVPTSPLPSTFRDELSLKGIHLCDSSYPSTTKYPVEIILGAEYCGSVVSGERIQVGSNLYAYETTFGWVPYGTSQTGPSLPTALLNFVTSRPVSTNIVMSEENYPSFLDSDPADKPLKREYLSSYIDQHVHFKDNRYSVDLPFLSPIRLTSNEQGALGRFNRLVKSLIKNKLFEKYAAAMTEQLEVSELAPDKLPADMCFYLPHHAVLRPEKETTQLRVVLDGSAHDTDSDSINENLFKMFADWDALATFLKFRLGKHAICADVKKAFWQISVEPHHRDYLRFWWIDEEGKTVAYRFKVLPFGLSCSPGVLYAVQQHLFNNNRIEYADVVPFIENSFYVDDFIRAENSMSPRQIDHLRTRTCELFAAHGMELRKWRTNADTLDSTWAPGAAGRSDILGFKWWIAQDTLHYDLDVAHFATRVITKRSFASFQASIYDPPGYLSPYIVRLRLFTRKLWKELHVNWDDPLPESEHKEAMELIQEASLWPTVSIRRNVLPPDDVPVTLTIFADASTRAIGVAVYVQSAEDSNLFYAKCKLARKATIVELELDALLLASKIGQHLQRLHPFNHTIVCSDSLINLQRAVQHPNKQTAAVALKVNKIKQLQNASFRHVRSELNVADLITRGCTFKELVANQSWWKCPPIDPITRFDQTLNKQVIVCFVNSKPTCACYPFHSYESAVRSYRMLASWAQRHCKSEDLAEYLSRSDIELAVVLLISSIQREHFSAEIDHVKQHNGHVQKTSLLRPRKCFVDKVGLLRLRTRFASSPHLAPDHLSPIILPQHCTFTQLAILAEHARAGHPGLERTIGAFRDRYFAVGTRRITRTLLKRCKICNIVRPNLPRFDYGSVPAFRFDATTPPFTNTGVDIFGPLKINMTTPGKRYAMIFSCATTRAVHLEIIRDMTAREVFLALRRFTSRRRTPDLFYSDNGRQLLAVRKQLLKLIAEYSDANPGKEIRFQWQLITAAAPWRAGFYERLIRVIKQFLMAFTYKEQLDDVELGTLMVEVEARMNSRPLFVYNGSPITPAHFFGGSEQTHLPLIGKPKNNEKRPQIVQDYLDQQNHLRKVWVAWIDKYLLQLRQFHQNTYLPNSSRNLQPGDVVLLKNFTAVDYWPLGIVDNVKVSNDGNVRTVSVRTTDRGKTVVKHRDVRTLVPLECAHEQLEFESTSDADQLDPSRMSQAS